ncbi:Deoxyguanosinetriphosphate triphospho hydrolase subgroup 1 [Salmonella bongori]|nr:Deoxyguanosinetriphosphate triphospho hydrolase subgroup 1 [Salmonella bongori]
MASIDFRNKINWHRRYRSPQGAKTEHEILRIFESDRGRIINSPAIRRLQQKTQVFPLGAQCCGTYPSDALDGSSASGALYCERDLKPP